MILRLSFLVLALTLAFSTAEAAELQTRVLPKVAGSNLAGVHFADAPKKLPIDTRFSQAIQTIAFNLSMACRQIEAYGWTLSPSEQNRVDGIFTTTASQLANNGYVVKPQNPAAAAEDITVYTATRPDIADEHLLFMWSAGDAGLLLILCDAKGSGEPPTTLSGGQTAGFVQSTPYVDTNPTRLVGEWMGRYTCRSQGPTAATLTVTKAINGSAHDDHRVDGVLSFYPSPENPGVASGSYRVTGTYDDETQQAFFTPGNWLQQPAGYTSHPFIAYFDLQRERVSAIFQDTTGCTSFEAGLKSHAVPAGTGETKAKKKATPKKKKKAAAKKPATVNLEEEPTPATAETTTTPTEPSLAPLDAEPVTVPATVPETSGDSVNAVPTDSGNVTITNPPVVAPEPAPVAVPSAPVTVPAEPVAPTAPAVESSTGAVPVTTTAPAPVAAPVTSAPATIPAPTAKPTTTTAPDPAAPAAAPAIPNIPTSAAPAAPVIDDSIPKEIVVPTKPNDSGVVEVAPKSVMPQIEMPADPNVNSTFGGLAVPPAKQPVQAR